MNSPVISKHYISASKLLNDSYELALQILDSDFRPDFIVGVWRGGTPVGIAVQELLSYCGVDSDHIAIRTSLYTGIDQQASYVRVHGLDYLVNNVNSEDGLLIVDDVFDSGRSVNQIILELHKKCRKNTPQIKIATPYFKPSKNKTQRTPDFYLHETEDWLVFPHELAGLSIEEILENKPEIESIKDKLTYTIKNR